MANERERSLLELLYRVSRELATAIDLRTVLQRVLYAALDNVGGERGSIVVMDEHGKPIDSIIVHGKRVQGDTTRQLRVTVERGLAGWVVRHGEAALLPDTSRDKRWLRRPDDEVSQSGAKSALCVPLLAREKIVGVLTLVHSQVNAFDKHHLKLIQAIADQAGVAVLNARLYTESQRQARVMTALADGAVTINASLQLKDVYQRIMTQTMQALQVETVALAFREKNSNDFVFVTATGQQSGSIIGKRVSAAEGLIGKVLQDRQGIVIPSLKQENPFSKTHFFADIESNAIAVAPIQAQRKIIGVIEAINPIAGDFDPDALLVMTGLGSLAGTTIQKAKLFEEVEETRKRYHDLFNDSIDPIFITDWNGNILDANRMAYSFSGYQNQDFRGVNIDTTHDLFWTEVGHNFEHLQYDLSFEYEALFNAKDGQKIPVDVYVRSIYFGKHEAIQWTFRDISERKELDGLRDDLTSMIYHDLRSPLANVISSIEVLGNLIETKNEGIESVLQIASNATGRMQRLISSLLDINRLEAGQEIATKRGVSPKKILREALEEARPNIEGRDQTIKNRVAEDLPNLWADEDMISRVLINLLENASKFTPSEGEIELGAEVQGDQVLFWVADNGIGISEEERPHVFKKFARAKSGKKVTGFGVGLAFCRLAVNGHDGKIWIDDKRDHGTRFNFTLPIKTEVTG